MAVGAYFWKRTPRSTPRKRKFTLGADDVGRVADDTAAFVERCRLIVDESVAREPDEPDPEPDL